MQYICDIKGFWTKFKTCDDDKIDETFIEWGNEKIKSRQKVLVNAHNNAEAWGDSASLAQLPVDDVICNHQWCLKKGMPKAQLIQRYLNEYASSAFGEGSNYCEEGNYTKALEQFIIARNILKEHLPVLERLAEKSESQEEKLWVRNWHSCMDVVSSTISNLE